MKRSSMPSFWRSFIQIEIMIKLIKSKWLYINIIIFCLAVSGYLSYRKFVYIPAQDNDYKIENYSLGGNGKKPFYQTQKDFDFVINSEKMKTNKMMKTIYGCYYNLYKKYYKEGILYTQNILLNENQFPEIYWMITDACSIIGLERIPLVFISNQKNNEIVLTSYRNPKIIIGSDYLWAYKQDELRYLLSRELVHIKCGHVFLLDMIKGLGVIADSWVPEMFSKFIFGNMGMEFMNWYREAQISADRGAITITGDSQVAVNALVKSNIGANFEDQYSEINPNELIKQLDKINKVNKTSKFAIMAELRNPTPFIILRVKNLIEFYNENELIFK